MVLLVTKSDPFWTTKTISISTEDKTCPDFLYTINHYQIKQILHNQNAWDLEENQTIQVCSANFESKLQNHKQYYLQGLSKSKNVQIYENEYHLENTTEAIIFIRPNWSANALEYCVAGAFHDPKDLNPIQKILETKQL